jgi:hypothetical protein
VASPRSLSQKSFPVVWRWPDRLKLKAEQLMGCDSTHKDVCNEDFESGGQLGNPENDLVLQFVLTKGVFPYLPNNPGTCVLSGAPGLPVNEGMLRIQRIDKSKDFERGEISVSTSHWQQLDIRTDQHFQRFG